MIEFVTRCSGSSRQLFSDGGFGFRRNDGAEAVQRCSGRRFGLMFFAFDLPRATFDSVSNRDRPSRARFGAACRG